MEYERVRRTLTLVLILNITVAIAKGIFGLLAGSVSMVADALHSSFDSVSNIVGIISIHISAQPPDRSHPYGHGKFETLGTLVIGGMLLLSAYWIVSEGIQRLIDASVPEISEITIAVLIGTIIINIFVTWWERRVGEETGSQILIADSQHTKSDIFVSCSVLAGFLVVNLGYPQADPLIAFLIGALIARMGLKILRGAGEVLTDAAVAGCEQDIVRIIRNTEGIRGYHKFRCRGKPDEIFADIHILVDPAITVYEGHEIAESLRKRILFEVDGMEDIVIHVDPAVDTSEAVT